MAGSLLICTADQRSVRCLDNGVLRGRYPDRPGWALFCLWSGVRHGRSGATEDEGLGSSRSSTARRSCWPRSSAPSSVTASRSRSAARCRGPTCATSWRSACSTPRTSWRRCRSPLTLGIDSVSVPMINAMTLEVNGNAITLSQACGARSRRPRRNWSQRRRRSMPARWPPSFAPARGGRRAADRAGLGVSRSRSQNYMLRLWLASGGIDPDRDVRLTVVPPPHTVAHLSGGVIDGYCVGEPWNQQAAALGIGRIAADRSRHLEGHAGEGAGHDRSLGRASSQHADGADQGADRSLRRGSTSRPTAPRPPASCRARAISTRRPR